MPNIKNKVINIINEQKIIDIHTHLFPLGFKDLCLYSIDNILTYHYLQAEFFRYNICKPEVFFKLSKTEQANLIWKELFIERTPLSEATLSVLTILQELGIAYNKDLKKIRIKFDKLTKDPDEYFNLVLNKAKIDYVVMTNDPYAEGLDGLANFLQNKKIKTSLRLDRALSIGITKEELERFIKEINPLYLAISLPPDDELNNKYFINTIIPVAEYFKLPIALMIGVKRGVNPTYGLAGDGMGKFNMLFLEQLSRNYPQNKFLVTLLSKENQHELCVLARKFSNIIPFGCWWFLNNPYIINEITSMRLEMLGLSFIPQHSDARILEHLISKWKHFKEILINNLIQRYQKLEVNGYEISDCDIKRDVELLLSGNFKKILGNTI
jgi:hypothetical protein